MAPETSLPPHLFRTNDPPTEAERTYIRDQINVARLKRETVVDSLLSHQKQKPHSEIFAEFSSLNELINNYLTLLSPFRYLPPELLVEILLFSVHERSFMTDLGGAVFEPDYPYILGLAQVCKYWRKFALATQELWTSIPFLRKWQSDTAESESLLQLMRTFIERSGNAPIHVTVLITNPFNNLVEGAHLESPCLNLLVSQCRRWKTAILHIDKSIVEKLVKLYAPVLDSLNFRCRYPAAWMFHNWNASLLLLAPLLKHVIIDSWQSHAFLRLPFSRIITFTGLPPDLESMGNAAPYLTFCRFRGPVSTMSYPTEPIRFDKLCALLIENNNYQPPNMQFGQDFETPFRWMAAPNLEVLIVMGHPILPGASLIVRDLLLTTLPSSSTLLFLCFNVRGLTEDDFKSLLSATPLLKYLDICDTPSHYFSHLIRVDHTTPDEPHQPLVPRLQFLIIRKFSDNDGAPLVALVDSRRVKGQQSFSLNLLYSSTRQCLQAQDRLEGWDEILKRESVPGSELTKVRGWATYIAKQFLGRSGEGKDYGVRRIFPFQCVWGRLIFFLVHTETKLCFPGRSTAIHSGYL